MKIFVFLGTRPEVIKMAPVIKAFEEEPWVDLKVISTAQHRELLDQMLEVFDIKVDEDFNVMKPNQKLSKLTSELIKRISAFLRKGRPDLVLAQGDTTTVMATAISCYYEKIPFGHVEAGLRSKDLYNPFPEEFNRIVADRLAELNFAPTEKARQNLINEGIPEEKIFVTGNTVIDALFMRVEKNVPLPEEVKSYLEKGYKLMLITFHRRESFGEPMREVFSAIKRIVKRYKDLVVLYPVHPNPNVKEEVFESLKNCERIILTKPLDYLTFVSTMKESYLILTDSGGVQEEAPALGKPVLVARDVTERPEIIEHGLGKLVGRNEEKIISEVGRLLEDKDYYKHMAKGYSPYGDGKASKRIVSIIKEWWMKRA
ncbi:MAG: UDP-N-acetylglucosamine 2-epimerase (non-hydrolyzing) [Thermodesulfobacteriota bacterium]|nr:MAG: UDP-N-acetylglucosamine 2-epimerase (non-hydrolyzing) [Thermodesulfobacteriota bacterium]